MFYKFFFFTYQLKLVINISINFKKNIMELISFINFFIIIILIFYKFFFSDKI
jgi:hypothetical protein